MTLPATLPAPLREALTREFAGEPIRWAGQPSPRTAFLRNLPIWLFAIPWTAFSLFWETMAIGGWIAGKAGMPTGLGGLFALFGLPFVLVGFGMMAAPFWMASRERRSVWAISDKRIACLTVGRRGTTVRSILPRTMMSTERTENSDGSGTLKLIFGDGRDSDGDKVERSETLQGIPEVRKVEDLIRNLFGKTAD